MPNEFKRCQISGIWHKKSANMAPSTRSCGKWNYSQDYFTMFVVIECISARGNCYVKWLTLAGWTTDSRPDLTSGCWHYVTSKFKGQSNEVIVLDLLTTGHSYCSIINQPLLSGAFGPLVKRENIDGRILMFWYYIFFKTVKLCHIVKKKIIIKRNSGRSRWCAGNHRLLNIYFLNV